MMSENEMNNLNNEILKETDKVKSWPNEEVPDLKFLQERALEASVMLSMLEHEIAKIRILIESGVDVNIEVASGMLSTYLKQIDELVDEMIANQI